MAKIKCPYLRQTLSDFEGYVPGEQPAAESRLIKLNTNENPYPPSPKVLEVMRTFTEDKLRKYPDPLMGELRQAAGKLLGIRPDWIIAGNGSDELLAMILRAYVDDGEVVTFPVPTYSLYLTLAELNAARVIMKPAGLGESKVDKVIDVPAKVTFIASPNSPDGYRVAQEDIRKLCNQRQGTGVVVVDEAYIDFTEGNCIELVNQFDNLIITRTLSKSFSLAGLRLGLAVAQPGLLEPLWVVKDSYNLGALPQAMAKAALEDPDWMHHNAQKIIATRVKTHARFEEMGWQVIPSHSNFLFVIPPAGNGREIYQYLASQGIYIRYFASPPLDRGIRVSIGSEEEMDCLFEALKTMKD